ncbi:hypothetical protein GCM10017710_05240 [Arthrobacter ramosus]
MLVVDQESFAIRIDGDNSDVDRVQDCLEQRLPLPAGGQQLPQNLIPLFYPPLLETGT